MTIFRENRNKLNCIELFFAIVLWSLFVWMVLPWMALLPLLQAINWTGFWPRYVVGFAFSTLTGGAFIRSLTRSMHEEVNVYIQSEYPGLPIDRIRAFPWFPEVFGYIERPMYTASYLLGKPEFIGIWLGVKMLARWSLPQTAEDKITDSRHRYYPVLIGNSLSVAYGVAGALVIKWLRFPLGLLWALITMLALVIGTLALTWYEKKWPHK